MKYKTLLKANLLRHKGALAGVFILILLAAAALGTVLTVWLNSQSFVEGELDRAGYGKITAWVSGTPSTSELADSIAALPEIRQVTTQEIIFSDYTVNGQESDSEGQLIIYAPDENRYRFFEDDLKGYRQSIDISEGEIYASPSLISMFDVKIGDEITFPIARAGKNKTFTVKGFYEDPFMGSSMIGMKGFLICEADRTEILSILDNAGIDSLARNGAMLHIFSSDELTVSELSNIINENTNLPQFTEFVHGKDAILGFMLVLHNAFCALLLAFAAVLLFVVLIVLSHNISSSIEADTANMGVLKTIGFTSAKLQKIQLLQYLFPIFAGLILGVICAVFLSEIVNNATLTTIGVKIPSDLPIIPIAISYVGVLLLLCGFIFLKTGRIRKITPIKAIRSEIETLSFEPAKSVSVIGNALHFRLALRQILSGKRRYIGVMTVSALLVFFASLVGRMYSWLGTDGKGMMDAFNPADHDIGVQIFGELTQEDTENTICGFSEITDSYLLAMPGVSVNGVDYTANVISEPQRFHILKGKTCSADNEIVLTEFVAANFGVSIGDTVTVRGDSGSTEFIVSGIYSCANDMGDNVGMSREGYLKIGHDDSRIWCWHYFLENPQQKNAITEALENAYGGDVHVHENTWPGLFGIISAMQALMIFMYCMVIAFILVVTVMTGSKILSAEQRDLGIYKAVGFKTRDLRLSFAIRFCLVSLIGSVVGAITAALFADPLVSAAMKLAGISNFSSAPNFGEIILPLAVVILMFMAFAYLAAQKIRKTDLTVLIAE